MDWEVKKYDRVEKRTATRRFNEGETIRIIPRLLNPDHDRNPHCDVSKDSLLKGCYQYGYSQARELEAVIWAVQFIMCHGQRGHYPAFYVRKENG